MALCRECEKFKGYSMTTTNDGKTKFGSDFCSGNDPSKSADKCDDFRGKKKEARKNDEKYKESS